MTPRMRQVAADLDRKLANDWSEIPVTIFLGRYYIYRRITWYEYEQLLELQGYEDALVALVEAINSGHT